MNVLFIASVYNHLTLFHIPYMKYLQDNGYKVWVASAKDEQTSKEMASMGFHCIDIPFSRNLIRKDNIIAFSLLKDLFAKEEFALVHVHTPVAALISRLAFRHANVGKMLYTAHGFHFYKGAPLLNWLLYYTAERFATRWTDRLITINEEDYKRALTMGYKKGTVHYICGVGVESITEKLSEMEKISLKRKLGLSEDSIVIAYIAEINKNKNQDYLLRNWKHIKSNAPKAVLLIIGTGILYNKLEEFIIRENLIDVHILGYRNDVNKLLRITDIVSLLSYREGLPKSIIEAMAAGIPCVVSETRGLRDLISNGKNGYVVKQNDDSTLVKAFISLLTDNEQRQEMGSIALDEVEQYLLENILQEYVAIYDKVLEKSNNYEQRNNVSRN